MQNTIFYDIREHFKKLWERSTFRFSDLKTSTQISLKFMLFTMLQVLLFSMLANAIFFQSRYNKQQGQIPPGPLPVMNQKMVLGKNRAQEVEIFAIESPEGKMIRKSRRRKAIAKIDDTYFMYRRAGDDLIVTNVTPHIVVQKNLIRISIYLMLFFGALSYILSRLFVRSSLRKLNELLGFLDHLHIDNLNEKIEITGHPQDEINRVSEKFNEVLEKIHRQTLSLKDFVTNASHELKTPLMSMSTEIDYANKTKQYEEGLGNLKQQLKGMDALLETLVTISKLEAVETLKKEQIDMSTNMETIVNAVEKIYQGKNITLTTHIQKNVSKKANKESVNIIVKNILDNAYKFTPEGGTIDISLDAKKFTIKDSGKGIPTDDLEHIRERFRQADRSKTDTKSFGLGLYLVKLLVDKHGWKIAISSKVNKGTICTINF